MVKSHVKGYESHGFRIRFWAARRQNLTPFRKKGLQRRRVVITSIVENQDKTPVGWSVAQYLLQKVPKHDGIESQRELGHQLPVV